MNVLLINSNPVVSRLFSLCTQEDDIILYEVSDISQIDAFDYDVVFIDDDAYSVNSETFLLTQKEAKKVLLSYENKIDNNFSEVVKKPFLPSKIIHIIQNYEAPLCLSSNDSIAEASFNQLLQAKEAKKNQTQTPNILDKNEIDKIKSLLEMPNDEEEIPLKEEEFEAKKVEIITQQLKAEGLEIVEEKNIIETLTTQKKVKTKKEKKEKNFVVTDEHLELIEEAIEIMMTKLSTKEIKKLISGKEITLKIKLEDINE